MRIGFIVAALVLARSTALADDGDILERERLALEAKGTVVERIVYESDGLRILGFLAYPEDAAESENPLPCLLYNRGGNRDFGAFTPEQFARLGGEVSSWGYVVFASNYRGSTGSEGKDEFGGADVHDVVNALRVFDQLEFADGERIGMWGHSRGGLMTYRALTMTDRVDAAIVGAGLADARRGIELRPDMESGVFAECVPDWAARRDEAIEERSPVRWADRLPDGVPVLLVQGTADWRVSPRDSLDMADAMLESKKPFRLLMLEGADHSLSEFRDEYRDAAREWLDAYVRDGKPLPNLEPHGA